jgi:molybdopterin synthase catalytic subunit/molybdopterin synthase sulfur carrier subunit
MRVRVVAFARLRELLGFGERELELAPAATLEDAWRSLTSAVPEAVRLRASTRFARNGVVADGASVLGDGDEIALLPPVGGG